MRLGEQEYNNLMLKLQQIKETPNGEDKDLLIDQLMQEVYYANVL